MRNIVKSQLYQLKKNHLVIVMFFLTPVLELTSAFGELQDAGSMTGSEFAASFGAFPFLTALLFVGTLVGELIGRDFMDRTTNYELMTGHTRQEVYLGRAIPALVIGTMGGMLISAVPVVAVSAVYGWGTKFALGKFLVRCVLMLFPLMRVTAVLIALTILTKNSYGTMALCFFLWMGEGLFSPSYILGISNMALLGSYEAFEVYGLQDYTFTMYDAALPASVVIATPLVSIAAAAAVLALGGIYFSKDDLR